MGIKVVVEAVWEPKQEGELDGLTVETPWSDESRVQEIARWCDKGLSVVGMIYTDLTPSPDDITKTLYKRHAQSYTASSLEMLLSAAYQLSHPLSTRMSPTGHYSSRFVTCCLTGDKDGGVDILAWQASEHAEAMVKAGIVEASVDPTVVRVRKPGEGEYVPEVFYSFKNEYGLQVKMPAKPTFPVEYLYVNVGYISFFFFFFSLYDLLAYTRMISPRSRMVSLLRHLPSFFPTLSQQKTVPGSMTNPCKWLSHNCLPF